MGKHGEGHHQKHLDKGCKLATNYLGYQSLCEKCPFPNDCQEGKPIKSLKHIERNKAIIADYRTGMGKDALIAKHKIGYRTIMRILEAWREVL